MKDGEKEESRAGVKEKIKSKAPLCGLWLRLLSFFFLFLLFGFLHLAGCDVIERRMEHLAETGDFPSETLKGFRGNLRAAEEEEVVNVPLWIWSCGGSKVVPRRHTRLLLIWACCRLCLLWPAGGDGKKPHGSTTALREQADQDTPRSRTLANMVCLLLSSSARPKVKKNWLPLSCGPAFAMATRPLRLKRSLEWNSS